MKAYVLLTLCGARCFRPLPRRNNDRSSAARFGVYSNTDAQDGIPLTELSCLNYSRIMVIILQQ